MFREMKTFVTKIDDSGALTNQIMEECFGSSGPDEEEQNGDEEYNTDDENEMKDDLPVNNPTKQVSFFGVDVNEPKSSEDGLPYGTKGQAPFEVGAPEISSVVHPVDENNNPMFDNHNNTTLTIPTSSVIVDSAAPVEVTAPVRAPIETNVNIKPAVSSSIAATPGSSASGLNPNPALSPSVTTLPNPSLPLPTTRHP